MKILLTTPPTAMPGGVAQYFRALRDSLASDVDYFTVGSRPGESALSGIARLFADARQFAARLRRSHYDMVHLNPSIGFRALLRDGMLLVIAKAMGKPVVVFVHGWDEHCGEVLGKRFRSIFRGVFGRADAFVVLAKQFEPRLRALGYSRPVFVHGAPVETSLLTDAGSHHRQYKPSVFRILFLARVEKEKGIYEALDAYAILKARHPFISMTVAGGGAERESAIRYATEHGLRDLAFPGHLTGEAKLQAYRNSDAYLFPSHSEGLPLSVLEAMAYGLPIVACAVGGLPDFFEDGRMGFLSNGPDPPGFADLLSRLIYDPELRAEIHALNRGYVNQHFAPHRIADQLHTVYRFVLDRANCAVLPAARPVEL